MSALPGMREFKSLGDRIKTLEAQVAKISRARTMQSTSLDGGTFRVKGGGAIEILDGSGNMVHTFDVNGMTVFEADGSTLLVLDGSKLRFNRADGSRQLEITPGGGLKIYQANGTTEKVVLDASGLEVDGGDVQGWWADTAQSSSINDATVNTTLSLIQTITIDPPSWVEVLFVLAAAEYQASGNTVQNINSQVRIDDGGASEVTLLASQHKHEAGVGQTSDVIAQRFHAINLSPAGRSVDISQYASVSTGTNTSNGLILNVAAFGVRSAFT